MFPDIPIDQIFEATPPFDECPKDSNSNKELFFFSIKKETLEYFEKMKKKKDSWRFPPAEKAFILQFIFQNPSIGTRKK